jgi:hypothetical protein
LKITGHIQVDDYKGMRIKEVNHVNENEKERKKESRNKE